MLYDEDGNPYVEPPLLPEDQRIFYIVRDYGRMYKSYNALEEKVKKLEEKLAKINTLNFVQRKSEQDWKDAVRHAWKWMKRHGVEPSPFLKAFVERKLLFIK